MLCGKTRRSLHKHTCIFDIVHTASHYISAYNEAILRERGIFCNKTFNLNGFSVVFIKLLGNVTVPNGKIIIANLDNGRIYIVRKRILYIVIFRVSVNVEWRALVVRS